MCWSCNPYCGGCKPPKPKPVKCPKCKSFSFPELRNCKKCGEPLPEPPKPQPVMCLFIKEVCTNPCSRSKRPPKDDEEQVCKWHNEADSSKAR